MKAIVQNDYGSPDVYELKEIDKPVVKGDEVLVRVHATGLNAGGISAIAPNSWLFRAPCCCTQPAIRSSPSFKL